jgi:hypothetical protein
MHCNLRTILLLLLFVSCSSKSNPEIQVNEQQWDYTAESAISQAALDSFLTEMRKTGYTFSSHGLCRGMEDSAARISVVFGHETPYLEPEIYAERDSIRIKLQFADFGCHLFTGDYHLEGDTLVLRYTNISLSSCYPKCFYVLSYTLEKPALNQFWIRYSGDRILKAKF